MATGVSTVVRPASYHAVYSPAVSTVGSLRVGFQRLRALRDRASAALGARASGVIGPSYALRTTAAAIASLLAARALGVANPIWAIVSSVVVILPGHGASVASAALRVIANLVGAAVGIGIAAIGMPPLPSIAIGLLLVAVLCRLLAIDGAARSASVSLLIVLSRPPGSVVDVSEIRVLQVLLGCAVAFVVTLVAAAIERARGPSSGDAGGE
jgi:uncharacterized membrane protein YccC